MATCSDFIIGSYISSDRNDVHTLIPFMEQLRKNYAGRNIGSVVVDSGYESEENYCWFEAHPETELYVKPSNHEAVKHRKYRTFSVLHIFCRSWILPALQCFGTCGITRIFWIIFFKTNLRLS